MITGNNAKVYISLYNIKRKYGVRLQNDTRDGRYNELFELLRASNTTISNYINFIRIAVHLLKFPEK